MVVLSGNRERPVFPPVSGRPQMRTLGNEWCNEVNPEHVRKFLMRSATYLGLPVAIIAGVIYPVPGSLNPVAGKV